MRQSELASLGMCLRVLFPIIPARRNDTRTERRVRTR
jgi:hypothetical protein